MSQKAVQLLPELATEPVTKPRFKLALKIETLSYGLLNRTYEIAMAEVSHRENVGLLAYSPLGMGLLTGKYRHGAKPEGSRMAVFERFTRYDGAETLEATEQYLQLADEHGLNQRTWHSPSLIRVRSYSQTLLVRPPWNS